MKLKEINLFCSDNVIDNSQVDESEESYPTLWNLLTNNDIDVSNMEYETGSDQEVESNNYTKQNQQCVTNAHPTIMHNVVNGPNKDPSYRSCRWSNSHK